MGAVRELPSGCFIITIGEINFINGSKLILSQQLSCVKKIPGFGGLT